MSAVTKELKIAFSLQIKASKGVSKDKFSLTIPKMLRFYRKSTHYSGFRVSTVGAYRPAMQISSK